MGLYVHGILLQLGDLVMFDLCFFSVFVSKTHLNLKPSFLVYTLSIDYWAFVLHGVIELHHTLNDEMPRHAEIPSLYQSVSV